MLFHKRSGWLSGHRLEAMAADDAAGLHRLTLDELDAAIAEYEAAGREDLLEAALDELADRGLEPDFALTEAAMAELSIGARSADIAGRASHFVLSLVAVVAFVAGVAMLAPALAR